MGKKSWNQITHFICYKLHTLHATDHTLSLVPFVGKCAVQEALLTACNSSLFWHSQIFRKPEQSWLNAWRTTWTDRKITGAWIKRVHIRSVHIVTGVKTNITHILLHWMEYRNLFIFFPNSPNFQKQFNFVAAVLFLVTSIWTQLKHQVFSSLYAFGWLVCNFCHFLWSSSL